MIALQPLSSKSPQIKLALAAGFFAAAFLLFHADAGLQRKLITAKLEYQTDQELSKNGEQYHQAYERLLMQTPLPTVPRMLQNDWIRSTQDLVRQSNLMLRELTPASEKRESEGAVELNLVLEGKMSDILRFCYALSKNGDWVYLSRFTLSGEENAEAVRAEMTLTQR